MCQNQFESRRRRQLFGPRSRRPKQQLQHQQQQQQQQRSQTETKSSRNSSTNRNSSTTPEINLKASVVDDERAAAEAVVADTVVTADIHMRP